MPKKVKLNGSMKTYVPVTWVHVSLALMQQNQERAGSRGGADCQASPLR